ncbi:MAG TPA: hypothetical protein VFW29_08645, partial [Solirubrobacteraceae bacterium]|nr:hypothetical protein [Solirubrobacteraceae bacterium]
TCPVLMATPEHDRVLPPPLHAPRYRREIPGVEAITLPGCGHVPMWDDTALVVRTIAGFIDRHAAPQQQPATVGLPAAGADAPVVAEAPAEVQEPAAAQAPGEVQAPAVAESPGVGEASGPDLVSA